MFWYFWICAATKIWYDVNVEAINSVKLLPTSILDMWNVFEHIQMMWLCIRNLCYHVTLASMILILVILAGCGYKIMGLC